MVVCMLYVICFMIDSNEIEMHACDETERRDEDETKTKLNEVKRRRNGAERNGAHTEHAEHEHEKRDGAGASQK